jgi:hypothetical protein
MVWDMLVANSLRLEKSPRCLVVGASTGAVTPKTMRKWMWKFSEIIAKLADNVVSYLYSRSHVLHCCLAPTPPVTIAIAADHLQEQVGHTQCGQQLYHDS